MPFGALDGIRVLDVTQVMAGPFSTMLLADLGAEVIKVESPGGDSSRKMAGARDNDSPSFQAVNRGKRGVVINLKHPEGQAACRRLAARCDILVENYRPGVMREFGLDYESLSQLHPGLIYCSISGYGQTGPYSQRGGFDLVAQGMSGIMSVTGYPGMPPAKCGIPVTDLGAGLFATYGILAALYHRTRTGRGQHIDTSLLEAGVALSVWESTEYFSGRGIPQPLGSAHRMSAPYQAVRCADGYITLGAANPRLFAAFCRLIGREDLISHPDYATDTGRVQHREALVAEIEQVLMQHPRAYWIERLDAAGIPCGPILNYAEVFADPHVQARGMVQTVDHPTLGTLNTLGNPVKFSATPPLPARPAPLMGQHTDAILTEVGGYTPAEIAALRAAGAVS